MAGKAQYGTHVFSLIASTNRSLCDLYLFLFEGLGIFFLFSF